MITKKKKKEKRDNNNKMKKEDKKRDQLNTKGLIIKTKRSRII